MKRVTMADFPGAPLIIVGDEALTPKEYASYRRLREYQNAWLRNKWATDPVFREKRLAYNRDWRARDPERQRAYNREWMRRKRAAGRPVVVARYSLHDLRCTGPTKSTGCRCHKVTVYERRVA